jgi:hypothetical protein
MIAMISMVVGIVMYMQNRKYNEDKNRIKELEDRLNEYYKQREQRLKDKGLID